MGPEKHIAYAVQWFVLSIALFGLYLFLGWRHAFRRKAPWERP